MIQFIVSLEPCGNAVLCNLNVIPQSVPLAHCFLIHRVIMGNQFSHYSLSSRPCCYGVFHHAFFFKHALYNLKGNWHTLVFISCCLLMYTAAQCQTHYRETNVCSVKLLFELLSLHQTKASEVWKYKAWTLFMWFCIFLEMGHDGRVVG